MTLVVLGSANVVAETPAEDPDGDKSKEDKPHEWVIAPIPVVEPNLGAGLGVVGIFLTPLNKKDEVSPKSIFGGGGFYTDNGSWAGALVSGISARVIVM